jgi:uncharacterized membrane protein YraQ (UPF0718 family)
VLADSLLETGRFFLILSGELILLFVGISFLVGLLLEYVSPESIQRVLGHGKNKLLMNALGAGFGALTPFCSCSTIPILLGMLKGGVPFGAAMSFLVASPLLNPIIILMLLGLMGWQTTLIYVGMVFPAAILAGVAWERMGLAADVKNVRIKATGQGGGDFAEAQRTTGARFKRALHGALNIFRQVFPWLMVGAAIGALIHGVIPQEWIVRLAGAHNPLAIPVAAVIGIPMYIRASTILPISSVLLAQGMGIGAVMALIIGGAGASIPEVTLLSAIFKRRLIVAFVVTVLLVAIATGFVFSLV